jgi:hypothetical protein
MVLCIVNNSRANIFNLIVLVIKTSVINSEFGLYFKLLSVKVYIIVFVKELIKIVYLSLILCVYSLCI